MSRAWWQGRPVKVVRILDLGGHHIAAGTVGVIARRPWPDLPVYRVQIPGHGLVDMLADFLALLDGREGEALAAGWRVWIDKEA